MKRDTSGAGQVLADRGRLQRLGVAPLFPTKGDVKLLTVSCERQ